MESQTYEEAVIKMVLFWSEKIQQPINQNNGDDSENGGMSFMLMNMAANGAQKSITPDKIKVFEKSLTERLMAIESKSNWEKALDVDYHPNRLLAESATEAGIDLGVFPCKTYTCIQEGNKVIGAMGYHGERKEL